MVLQTGPGGVYTDEVYCSGSPQVGQSRLSVDPATQLFPFALLRSCCLFVVMALSLRLTEFQIKTKPDIIADLRRMLLQAEVDLTVVDFFRVQGVRSSGTFVALAHSDTDFRCAVVDLFGIDKTKGALHRTEAAKLVRVWKQGRIRSDTQLQFEASARAHGLPQDLSHGN